MHKLIGFCGYARSGKDTAAEALVGFKRKAFAEPLKYAVDNCIYNLLVMSGRLNELEDKLFTFANSVSPHCTPKLRDEVKHIFRPMYVALGAGMRAIDPDFWIKALDSNNPVSGELGITSLLQTTDVVISDVRYANEVRFILNKGGSVYRVHREGFNPANAEEERSFGEIEVARKEGEVCVTDIYNKAESARDFAIEIRDLFGVLPF